MSRKENGNEHWEIKEKQHKGGRKEMGGLNVRGVGG